MRRGGVGGAKTQKAGARFEESTAEELIKEILRSGYQIVEEHRPKGNTKTLHGLSLTNGSGYPLEIYYQDGLYKLFFEPRGINWKDKFSSRLKPDTAIYSTAHRVLTIVEKKQQETEGSVAEKLQTCDYKLNYYTTLTRDLNIKVQLFWLLGSYFENKQESLRSVFDYMEQKGSRYFFHRIPLKEFVL